MPVDLPVGDHALFLWTAVATHALVGCALGAIFADEPAWGLAGGVAADVDLLFPLAWEWPLVHRGATHTAVAALLVAVLVARRTRPAGVAVGVGYVSHLAIDATTPSQVPLFYPLSDVPVGVPVGGHSRSATVLLWIVCLASLYRWRR